MSKISIRLSDEEEAALRDVTEASGTTISDLIRACISEKFPQISARIEQENATLSVLREGFFGVEKRSESIERKVVELGKNLERQMKEVAGSLAEVAAFLASKEGGGKPGGEVEKAVFAAQETRRAVDEMSRDVKRFCSETVPLQTGRALDEMLEKGVQNALRPLQESVGTVVAEIDRCGDGLKSLSWNRLLLVGPFVTGIVAVLFGGLLIYWFFLGDNVEAARRYETLGRSVTERFTHSPKKEQQTIQAWINGDSLPGGAAKKER